MQHWIEMVRKQIPQCSENYCDNNFSGYHMTFYHIILLDYIIVACLSYFSPVLHFTWEPVIWFAL